MRHFFLLLSLLLSLPLSAQRLQHVEASLTWPMESQDCLGDFRERLLQQTRLQALAKAFPLRLQQGSDLAVSSQQVDLRTLTSSQIQGEWVRTLSQELSWSIRKEQGQEVLYLTCSLRGEARALPDEKALFTAYATAEERHDAPSSTVFRHGDPLFLHFESPQKGYLAVFLQEEGQLRCLFPYTLERKQDLHLLQADQPYLLFSALKVPAQFSRRQVHDLQLFAKAGGRTRYVLRVFFSDKRYELPSMQRQADGVYAIPQSAYDKWLSKLRLANPSLQEQQLYLAVEAPE